MELQRRRHDVWVFGARMIGSLRDISWCAARCLCVGAMSGGSPPNSEDPCDTPNRPSPHRESSAPTTRSSLFGCCAQSCTRGGANRERRKSALASPVMCPGNHREKALASKSKSASTRDTYPPHFSRLSRRAFVNDAASRAQVDVEANFLARDRPNAASGSSGCRCAPCLSLAQPPFTHPNLTSCVCRPLFCRRRRSPSGDPHSLACRLRNSARGRNPLQLSGPDTTIVLAPLPSRPPSLSSHRQASRCLPKVWLVS